MFRFEVYPKVFFFINMKKHFVMRKCIRFCVVNTCTHSYPCPPFLLSRVSASVLSRCERKSPNESVLLFFLLIFPFEAYFSPLPLKLSQSGSSPANFFLDKSTARVRADTSRARRAAPRERGSGEETPCSAPPRSLLWRTRAPRPRLRR